MATSLTLLLAEGAVGCFVLWFLLAMAKRVWNRRWPPQPHSAAGNYADLQRSRSANVSDHLHKTENARRRLVGLMESGTDTPD